MDELPANPSDLLLIALALERTIVHGLAKWQAKKGDVPLVERGAAQMEERLKEKIRATETKAAENMAEYVADAKAQRDKLDALGQAIAKIEGKLEAMK